MKLHFVLAGLLACHAGARISFAEIMQMHSKEIGKEGVCINPSGPVSLMRGYIYAHNAYMYNKRFFSPEIETDYSLRFSRVGKGYKEVYQQKRSPTRDRAYKTAQKDSPGRSEPAYTEKYHSALLKLFPSTNGTSLSISVSRKDCMFRFLQKACAREQASYVLAALLLLGEGVDVPIEIERGAIVLWKSRALAEQHRLQKAQKKSLPIPSEHILCSVNFQNKKMMSPQKEAVEIVHFFKAHAREKKLPVMQEDFETGDFLDSLQFLVQAYIFEYIESMDSALEFAWCVHSLLKSMGAGEPGQTDRIFGSCFMPKEEKAQAAVYLEPLARMQECLSAQNWFPFSDSALLPKYMNVPLHSKSTGVGPKEEFSNCAEAGLYALFCCLAYDPEEKKYNVGGMLGEVAGSEDAQKITAFFNSKSADPKKCATRKVFEAWNQVVSGLPGDSIAYCRDSKNEVRVGILNFLRVVSKVTGRLPENKKELDELAESVRSKKEPAQSAFKEVQEHIERVLKMLSVNRRIEVETVSLKKGLRSDGEADLYGSIVLRFSAKENSSVQGICLNFITGHLSIGLLHPTHVFSEEDQKAQENSVREYRGLGTFAGCLFAEYIEKTVRAYTSNSMRNLDCTRTVIETAKKVVESCPEKVNRVFLDREISCSVVKMRLVNALYLYAKGEQVAMPQTHPIVRLLSNVLGSVPLDNPEMHKPFLGMPILLGELGKMFPRIQLSESKAIVLFQGGLRSVDVYIHTQYGYPGAAEVIMQHLLICQLKGTTPVSQCKTLNCGFLGLYGLFECMFARGTKRNAEKLGALLLAEKQKERKDAAVRLKNSLDLFWFVVAVDMKADKPDLVFQLYAAVDPDAPRIKSPGAFKYFVDASHKKRVLKWMKLRKHHFIKLGGKRRYSKSRKILEAA
ncbi:uncharacterized protein NEMAJ01_1603 [Nematocida major]|uniref:uncharacterized protein n=1 Tax=Nematocida major TaxID=1912982 RepID=UPI0020079D7C|nr:uncharacterized protein NEMAJ01_1603 [Nematocida major]KAH9386707.1 hypothetical protein NEMAJ01_1603 [Nematocida major]